MIWLFDVDGTLVDSFDGMHLRPLVNELFDAVERAGASIAVWSAGGVQHAERLLEWHRLGSRVSTVLDKRVGVDGLWILDAVLLGAAWITCVDDQPSQLPPVDRRFDVFPYLRPNPHDRALAAALTQALEDLAATTPRRSPEPADDGRPLSRIGSDSGLSPTTPPIALPRA